MKIKYKVPVKGKVVIGDHWPIPVKGGGKLEVIESGGFVEAIEIAFEKQPLEYAPTIESTPDEYIKATISGSDGRLKELKAHLDDAISFLQCLYNVDVVTDEIEAIYEPEDKEEEEKIKVKSMDLGRKEGHVKLPFDILARALMVAEDRGGPKFEAALLKAARGELFSERYIDAFRYSFLLIEALCGEGKFKKEALKSALKKNKRVMNVVREELGPAIRSAKHRGSDTDRLLLSGPNEYEVVDHIVEKRGFYFHGNKARKDAWKPNEQNSAHTLSVLTVIVAQSLSQEPLEPLFDVSFQKRFFDEALECGAIVVYKVMFKMRNHGEGFQRSQEINIKMPGTKMTNETALVAAQQFLEFFKEEAPHSVLDEAVCVLKGTGEKAFEIRFSGNQN